MQDNASPLHVAAGSCNAGSADIIYVLHQLGSEEPALRRLLAVDVLDAHGKTPLHAAVEAGNVPAIEALIELGANIEQVGIGAGAAVRSGRSAEHERTHDSRRPSQTCARSAALLR